LDKQVETLSNTSKSTVDSLERTAAAIDALKAEITALDASITAKETQFNENEDTTAIATLIEITGPDFKAKREAVVTHAQDITTHAVEGIEKSIGRFES